jgi:formate/nitrite transporter
MIASGNKDRQMQEGYSNPKAGDSQRVTFEAIMPAELAVLAEESGVRRVALSPMTVFVLSVLGGAFISMGAVAATTVSAGSITITGGDGAAAFAAGLPYGITRLLTGLVFTLGLILIVLAGAELFTGNNLIVMAWASGRVSTRGLLLNWTLVFIGNLVGAICTAILMFGTTQYTFGAGAVGLAALSTAHAKASLGLVPALTLAIMCNALVCLAVWMCYGARTIVDRVCTIVPPIAAFAAVGFEHCIANMYFVPMGLFIKAGAPDSFWTAIGKTADDFPALTWGNFWLGNLLPVTIGNVIGGSVLVGGVYWFIYLRKSPPAQRAKPAPIG